MLSGLVKLGVRGWSLLLTGEVGDRNVSGYWGPERILCVGKNNAVSGQASELKSPRGQAHCHLETYPPFSVAPGNYEI